MTNITFSQKDISIDTLFKNGICLTFNPLDDLNAFSFAQELRKKYCKANNTKYALIKTNVTLANDSLNANFHYFSNGVLIYNFFHTENKDNNHLKRILEMLKIRKLPVNKIYDLSKIFNYIDASVYMEKIYNYAKSVYQYKDNIKIVNLPPIQDFVNECFKNNNILLTVSQNEDTTPNIRKCMALFADGSFFVSEEYQKTTNNYSTNIDIFKNKHDDLIFLNRVCVPQRYIDALNKEAEKYDWFISNETLKQQNNISDIKFQTMDLYISNLFASRKCLSVTNFEFSQDIVFSSRPDIDRYVLFSDGLLVVSNECKNAKNASWIDKIKLAYNITEVSIDIVPDYYITKIYSALPKYQRGAKNIYLEMLKERAKKIKKEQAMSYHIALDIASKIDGWKDYNSITIEDEAHARNLISRAKRLKKITQDCWLKNFGHYLK